MEKEEAENMRNKNYNNYKSYIPIIGLEVHIELKTKSKMFCGCDANYFGKEPNTQTCPVCLGLPGALPVPNRKAVEWCILIGLALGCKIPEFSRFDRKNYFYPDLPKGYQISQYDEPLCIEGNVDGIRIRRVHMEEDTGKLIHGGNETLIDFNRSGAPLVEIVTEPDFRTVEEVDEYLRKIQKIVRYLGVTDAEMEKGTMRCEPSISMRLVKLGKLDKFDKQSFSSNRDGNLPNYRVEVKNINSFKFARRAIEYEIKRQTEILGTGGKILQETRGWSESKNATLPQRSKEEAHEYRYFPEPDIPPMRWSKSQIAKYKSQIPELPDAKFARFIRDYKLDKKQAEILTERKETADFYEESLKVSGSKSLKEMVKTVANYLINRRPEITKVTPEEFVKTINQISQTGQISQNELEEIIGKILKENRKAVEDYQKGKEAALQFLVGQVMRETKGKTSAELILKFIQETLDSRFCGNDR